MEIKAKRAGNKYDGYHWIAYVPALAVLGTSPKAKAETKDAAIDALKEQLEAQRRGQSNDG